MPPKDNSIIPVSVKVIIKSVNKSHSILASFRGEEPILCAIDDYEFNTPSFISGNLILFKANHYTDLLSQLLGKYIDFLYINFNLFIILYFLNAYSYLNAGFYSNENV